MRTKLFNIQALRGLAVLLVVCYHIIPIENKYNPEYVVMPSFFRIGNIGVDIFFIISGFIMVVVTNNNFNRSNFFSFAYLRITRIYPLYWFYSLMLLPLLFLKPEWINSSQNGEVDIVSSFLLLPSEILPLIMVGWSLIHEMYFYIIFSMFILFINKKQLLLYSSLWACIIIVLGLLINFDSPLAKLITNPLTIEFIFGILIGIYFTKYRVPIRHAKILLIISFSTLLIAFYQSDQVNNWSRILIYGLPALLIVFFSIEVEKQNTTFHKLLITIGDASFSIYLSHIMVLSVVAKLFNFFSHPSYMFELCMVICMLITTLAWGILSYKYIEIPMVEIFKKFYRNHIRKHVA